MTHPLNAMTQADVLQLAVAATRTSSLDGTAIDVAKYEGIGALILNAGAATAGTTPTLNVKLQHCDTQGGTYTDVTGAAFAQVTDGAGTAGVQKLNLNLANVKRWVKVIGTIAGGGGTPTFAFSACLLAIKKAP